MQRHLREQQDDKGAGFEIQQDMGAAPVSAVRPPSLTDPGALLRRCLRWAAAAAAVGPLERGRHFAVAHVLTLAGPAVVGRGRGTTVGGGRRRARALRCLFKELAVRLDLHQGVVLHGHVELTKGPAPRAVPYERVALALQEEQLGLAGRAASGRVLGPAQPSGLGWVVGLKLTLHELQHRRDVNHTMGSNL